MTKKAVFLDADGTIYSHTTNRIPESSKAALKELAEREDIDVYLSSGRSSCTICELEEVMSYFDGFNLANGGEIKVKNGKEINNYFPASFSRKFISRLEELKISYGAVVKNKYYRLFYTDEVRESIEKVLKAPSIDILEGTFNHHDEVIEFWVICTFDEVKQLEKEFPDATFYFWGRNGADVVPGKRSKATGIKTILDTLGYNIENTFAIGDSFNDIPMFQLVNTSICMGQGSDEVKAKAKYVTDDIEKDGFAKAVRKYILSK